jgi:hypothetical protein
VEGHNEYIVEKILASNWLGKHFQYKIHYEGYGKEHDEWQFRDNLLEDLGETLLNMEKEFYKEHLNAAKHMDEIKRRVKGKTTIKKR